MNTHRSILLLPCLLLAVSVAPAQDTFDMEAYQQFLSDHANMQSQNLLEMYPAKTQYWSKSVDPVDIEDYDYLDSIAIKLMLTEDELAALRDNHFVVSERLKYYSMGKAFVETYYMDLPVFVTTDAILHVLHKSYDSVLFYLEYEVIIPQLEDALDAMAAAYPAILNEYQGNPDMIQSLRDIDLYITMARSLLQGSLLSPQYVTPEFVQQYWDAVQMEQFVSMPLFSEASRDLDFSQFTVRGHYTNPEEMSQYFQAMMWLGRMDFLLSNPPQTLPSADILRMNIDAVLMMQLLNDSGEREKLDRIDGILEKFIGECDNLTTSELAEIIASENIQGADELLDGETYASFKDAIQRSPFSDQKILSNVFMYDLYDEPPPLPVSFRLMGQRYIVDSYVTSKVVFPNIRYQDANVWRPMPDPLDVMFALGNEDALPLIQQELDTYNYATALAGTRYLVDSYTEDFWSSSFYNLWLNSIRELNPPEDDSNLPLFMKTTGWHQQKLNTQLASWAQLRHDNILYAKQSYTGGILCSYPYGYVEPYPDFYGKISSFASNAASYYSVLNGQVESDISALTNFYLRMESIMDTLQTLSIKELNGTPFTEGEEEFVRRVVTKEFLSGGCGPDTPGEGWYVELFFGYGYMTLSSEAAFARDFIVADVHTQPTDEGGALVGNVLHVGLGMVNIGVFLVEQTHEPTPRRAYIGPTLSYYEHTTSNFDRLTDERWAELWGADQIPDRPDWVNAYLIDRNGEAYTPGRELPGSEYSSVSDRSMTVPAAFNLSQNYPNPFNPLTQIAFTLPEPDLVSLTIYDVLGRSVFRLVNQRLEKGYHQYTWNGSDGEGRMVPSGVYFYQLKSGSMTQSRKMVLLK